MDGWMGGWVGGWKDGWIDGWVFMRKNTEMFRLSQLTTTNLSSTADQNCYFFPDFHDHWFTYISLLCFFWVRLNHV